MKNVLFHLAIIVLICSCQNEPTKPINNVAPTKIDGPLFKKIESSESGINFVNRVVDNDQLNYFSYFHFIPL